MAESQPKPWERQDYETQGAWVYFQLYLEQDPPRGMIAAYKKWRATKGQGEARIKNAPGSWRNLAAGKTRRGEPIPGAMTWEQRARAWDDYIADLERQKWAERRLQLKEQEWEVGQSLLDKAKQMLMFPVFRQENADGTTTIYPAEWKFRDIPAVASAASKLARLAAGMSTEHIQVDWREEARQAGIENPDAIFSELVTQFEAQLAREDDARGLGGSEAQPGESQE